MDTERLRQFAQHIWDSTSPTEAYVRVGGSEDEIALIGNRDGLLLLAAEILAATCDGSASPGHLFTVEERFHAAVKHIGLEGTPPSPKLESWLRRVGNNAFGFGCLAIIVLIAICALIGLGTVIKAVIVR